MAGAMRIEGVFAVEFVPSRWNIRILVALRDGTAREFVASADRAMTGGDGIYFETAEQYAEDEESV